VIVETIRDALPLGVETSDGNHVQNMLILEKTDSVISRTEQAFYLTRIFCLIQTGILFREGESIFLLLKSTLLYNLQPKCSIS